MGRPRPRLTHPASPTPADINAATAATQGAIDRGARLTDIERAAQAEAAAITASRHTPERHYATPDRQLERELEAGQ